MPHLLFSSVLITIGPCIHIIKAIKQSKINRPSSTHGNLHDYNPGSLLGKYVTKTMLVELGGQEANALSMQVFSYMCN